LKRLTISITGLPKAGKTSFTQRLLTGSFITTQPTFGVDVEFADYKGYPLQIWDMGGHMAFRKHIWRNYVEQSSALIFIFDASDFSTLTESKEWFWLCLSWIEKKGIPVLFLANKWDLVEDQDTTLDKIVEGFNLSKLATIDSKTSFRFFFISVKTGAYISDAMNWLIIKNFVEKRKTTVEISSFDIFLSSEQFSVHIHDSSDKRLGVHEIIETYQKKWFQSEKDELNVFEEMKYDEDNVFFLSFSGIALLITTKSDFIDRSVFINILELIKSEEKIVDKTQIYDLFDKIKNLLLQGFLGEISSSLICDVAEEFA
jgi:small GTP-binding protein